QSGWATLATRGDGLTTPDERVPSYVLNTLQWSHCSRTIRLCQVPDLPERHSCGGGYEPRPQSETEVAGGDAGHRGGLEGRRGDGADDGAQAYRRRGDLDDGADDRHVAQEVLDALEEVVERVRDPAQPEEAVARGVGEGERVVDDVAVAVPGLPVERVGHHG